jgi:hypothetical protein
MYSVDEKPSTAEAIDAECKMLAAMLKGKNAAYGDSLTDPVRIFSKADTLEQINVRLDDKLSRIIRGDDAGEDAELDLLGYLIMKRVCARVGK